MRSFQWVVWKRKKPIEFSHFKFTKSEFVKRNEVYQDNMVKMNWENFQLGTHCHRKQLEFPIFGSETKIYNSVEPCSAHILHEYQQHEGILYNFKVKGGKRIGCGQQLTSVSAFWFFYFKGKLSQSLCCIDSVRPLPIQYRVYTIDYSA